jgi:mono/diheme cytochrome c family protein
LGNYEARLLREEEERERAEEADREREADREARAAEARAFMRRYGGACGTCHAARDYHSTLSDHEFVPVSTEGSV